nr:hypothetical protein [Microbacterium hydrocarbonoxydans]
MSSARTAVGAVTLIATLLLASCASGTVAETPTPAPEPTPAFSDPTVSITYEKDGETHELVGHPEKPLCDWDGIINVIGEDPLVPNGVTLQYDEGAESSVSAWVGDEGVAAMFQSRGEVSIVRDDETSVLFVTDLEGHADIAPREEGVPASINTVTGEYERVDATLTFAVTCPND